MSAHTPGPWKALPRFQDRIEVTHESEREGAASSVVARVTVRRTWEREQTANANLITASPDLYDAAENALNVIIACCKPTDGVDDAKAIADARTMLRAALAKANGG